MKIAIAGNCQADALRWIGVVANPDLQIPRLPAYHELTAETEPLVHDAFEAAEYVFAQRVSHDFYIESLRPEKLRERYGAKCTLWPNIYFDGYFPGVRYLYRLSGHKVVGPLGDYHFQQIIDGWVMGQDAGTIAASLMSTQGWPWCAADPAAHSLDELRRRETDCDVAISDHIERNFRHRKLMHSMNHPVNSVLLEMLDRLMARNNLPGGFKLLAAHQAERLSEMELPVLPIGRHLYMPGMTSPVTFQGLKLVQSEETWHSTSGTISYQPQELVSEYIKVYDSMPDQLKYLRQT